MPLAVEWTNLHQILRSLYADMLPLCSDMMGIAKGLAGLGALFFIAYRVWKSLAAAEPIEVFPLLRPFVLGLCIMAFPTLVLGPLNGLLSPISNATSHLVDRQAFDLEKYQTQKDELQRQAMLRDPEKAYLISNEEFDKRLDELGWKPKDLMAIAGMYAERAGYQFGQKVREAFRTFLETLFQAASLTIDTVRTFFLIVLALLGPVAFAFSVYDGFHNTLASWLARYICIYLWLPVSDLFGAILSRIQILMLQQDIERLQDPTFIPDGSNTVYCIFMIIGIVGYFCVPTVASWIIQAGGAGSYGDKVAGAGRAVAMGAAGVAGAAVGNVGGRYKRGFEETINVIKYGIQNIEEYRIVLSPPAALQHALSGSLHADLGGGSVDILPLRGSPAAEDLRTGSGQVADIWLLSQDMAQNRPVEAREHVRRFHELFFTLSPDREAIEGNVRRALYLADGSAIAYYQNLAEKGYFNRIIASNVSQNVVVDSIRCDFDCYPYAIETFARQKIVRESNVTERTLVHDMPPAKCRTLGQQPAGIPDRRSAHSRKQRPRKL